MDTLTVTETPTDSCLSKLCLRIVFFRCRVVLDKNKEGSKYCSITKADVLGHFFCFWHTKRSARWSETGHKMWNVWAISNSWLVHSYSV